jgi:hypothetical protein
MTRKPGGFMKGLFDGLSSAGPIFALAGTLFAGTAARSLSFRRPSSDGAADDAAALSYDGHRLRLRYPDKTPRRSTRF